MELVRFEETFNQKVLPIAEPSEQAKLISEIASRLLELYDDDKQKFNEFLTKLFEVHKTTKSGLILLLTVLTGSRDELKTYSQLATETGKSKQYIHAQRKRDLKKLKTLFPEIEKVLKESIWSK